MPDHDLVQAKAESIGRCLSRIREKTPPSAADLEKDYDAQDILSVNLQRAIQLSVDLGSYLIAAHDYPTPPTMAETFKTLETMGVIEGDLAERLRRAVGFRNISVHEYDQVDWNIVFSLVTTRLEDFRLLVERILAQWKQKRWRAQCR